MMRKTFWAALAAMAISGCASNPPLNFSVPGVAVSEKKLDAELRSMTVTLARPDEAKGKMPAAAQHEVAQMWQTALTEALNRAAIFRDDAPRKLNLSVKILAIDIPAFGASMTTKTIARYELIDRASGAVAYSRDVTALGTVPMNYAFIGVVRARESLNRSAQDNIGQFLQALKDVDPGILSVTSERGAQ